MGNKKIIWALVFLVIIASSLAEECVCPRIEQPSVVMRGFTFFGSIILTFVISIGAFIALRVNKFNLGYKIEEMIGLEHGVIISSMIKDEAEKEVVNRAVDKLEQQIIGNRLVPKEYYQNPTIIQSLEARDYVKLVDYIKSYISQGRDKREVTDWLLKQGIHPQLIERAFSDVN